MIGAFGSAINFKVNDDFERNLPLCFMLHIVVLSVFFYCGLFYGVINKVYFPNNTYGKM